MTIWTLKYNGTEKTFAEWGIRNVRKNVQSLDIDTVTFEQPVASAYEDPLFAEGAIVEIFTDTTDEEDGEKARWFYGRAEDAAPILNGQTAVLRYTISGPWWWLATMGFRQSWKVRNSAGELETQYSSYCLLGSRADGVGTQQSIADQIAEAVNYAISQDAPLAFDGTGLPTVFPPIRDAWNMPVAEVIRRMVEWTPDIASEFDYSTDPYPTLRMRRREDQEAVTLDVSEAVSEIDIKARNDLKVPGVIIYYIRTDTANGSIYTVINEDKFPAEVTGREPKALLAAINLEGASITYAEAEIVCEAIEPLSVAWWKRHDAHLHSTRITNLQLSNASYTNEDGEAVTDPLPRELFGTWAPWMGGNVQTINVRVLASWVEEADSAADGAARPQVLEVKERPLVCSIVSTNLTSGVKRSNGSGVSGEAQPIGLAEALYKAASVLHYDVRITLKEAQCAGRVSMGNVLNVTGGREAWQTMRAQVQSVTEDVDSGLTTIIAGPPRHLGPDDYIELLRATRNRIRFAAPESRVTGITGGNSAILPKTVSKQVATAGQGGVTQQMMVDPLAMPGNGRPLGRVNMDLNHVNGRAVQFREITVCDNNRERKMIVLCSEIYD